VPFFPLATNLMNSVKVTDRLIELARVLTGWMLGGLGHVNVAVSMLFAGISGSSTAEAAGCGKILIPAMQKRIRHPLCFCCSACSLMPFPPSSFLARL
jgi:TRAP-type C4-dicarboxylate transport system permease large subunit